MRKLVFCILMLLSAVTADAVQAQERVYVATDKDCYVAGENLWCSVYCLDSSDGACSSRSSVAFLEFHSRNGVESVIKVPLIEGRGCGRLQIPLDFATGNYSIVAYTRADGGNSVGEFRGKTITIFNTLTSGKVEGGVEVVDEDEELAPRQWEAAQTPGKLAITLSDTLSNMLPIGIENLSGEDMQLNVSVYHIDRLTRLLGTGGYNNNSLLQRTGDFERTSTLDYAGEVIRARILPKDGRAANHQGGGMYVYMSAMGNTDDLYISNVDKSGHVTYYTNNISGKRDLVFEVVDGDMGAYNVEIVDTAYRHVPAEIPVLKISSRMREPLQERGMNMQIAKRFEEAMQFDLMDMRINSFYGAVEPVVFNLDDYTRFPVMEEVVREYVTNLRIRKVDGRRVFKVLWQSSEAGYKISSGKVLVLLDGVPVEDHSKVIDMDPHLVRQIVIYPRKFVLNYFVFDGIVKFNTYKEDLGGVKLGENVAVLNHDGVQYPLAFTAGKVAGDYSYPNYNNTVYWNPLVSLRSGGRFGFNCILPAYRGEFRIVVEGIDGSGEEIYRTATFKIE